MNLICKLRGHHPVESVVAYPESSYREIVQTCRRCGKRLSARAETTLGMVVQHATGDVERRSCWLCHKAQWHMWLGPWGWVCLGYPHQRMHKPGDDVRV